MATNDHLSLPSAAAGLSIATPASSWDYSSYTEIRADGTYNDIELLGLSIQPNVTTPTGDTFQELLVEITAGPSDTVIAQIPVVWRIDTKVNHVQPVRVSFAEPLTVSLPRIRVRVADSNTSALTHAGIKLYYRDTGGPPRKTITGKARIHATTPQTITGKARIVEPFPTVAVVDNFNRSDENPLGGGWASTPVWTGVDVARLISNKMAGISGDAHPVYNTSYNESQESFFTITDASILDVATVVVRGSNFNSSTPTYYAVEWSNTADTYKIEQVVAGSGTVIVSATSITIGTGDSIGLRANGSEIEFWHKPSGGAWKCVRRVTDATITGSGRTAGMFSGTITGAAFADDYGAGNFYGRATTPRTITGKARVTAKTLQTITGKASIAPASVTQTITGKARITVTTLRTITGKAKIGSTFLQTITGKARITATTLQTITGKGRVTVTTLRTITGKANIGTFVTTAKTITGKARIATSTSIAIDSATSLQTMRYWEATAQAGHDSDAITGDENEYPSDTFPSYKTALIAAMIELGITRMRLEFNVADVNATGYSVNSSNNAIQPSTASSGQWHYDRFKRFMDAIGTDYRAAMAARGETVEFSICIVDFKSAGYAVENTPSEYAFMVNRIVQEFYDTYGFRPYAIEAILEPDNGQASAWTPARIANNIVQANTTLVSNGHTGIKWIAPSTEATSNNPTYWADMKTANSGVTALVDELSYHRYQGTLTDIDDVATAAASDGKKTIMSEWIGATYHNLYEDITRGKVSSWEQYTIAFPYPGWTDDGAQYFGVNTTTWAVTQNTRTKYLYHYFKWIKTNAVRKKTTSYNGNLLATAYQNPSGKYVAVIHAAGSVTASVIGLPAGTYGIRRTYGDGSSAPSAWNTVLSNVTIADGEAVSVAFTGAGVATVFELGYSPVLRTVTGKARIRATTLRTITGKARIQLGINAAAGSFAIAGQAAGLQAGRPIAAGSGSFAIAGQAAGLAASRRITAEAGAFGPAAVTEAVFLSGALNAPNDTAYFRNGDFGGFPKYTLGGSTWPNNSIYRQVGGWWIRDAAGSVIYGAAESVADPTLVQSWQDSGAPGPPKTCYGTGTRLLVNRLVPIAAGSFALAGQAAGLAASRTIAAAPGSFALAGQPATLTGPGARTLVANVGSFALAGQAAALRRDPKLIAASGALTLTGNAAGLARAITIAANVGAFSVAGNALALLRSFALTQGQGSFTLAGQAAGLRASRVIGAAAGGFTLTGNAAALTGPGIRTLLANAGSFALAGQIAGLRASRTIGASPGSFALAGQAAALTGPGVRTLLASLGSFALAGQTAAVRASRVIGAAAGPFTLIGPATGLTRARFISIAAGSFSVAGQGVNLAALRALAAARGVFGLGPIDTSLRAGRIITGAPGAFSFIGNAAGLDLVRKIAAGSGGFALAGLPAGLRASRLIAGSPGAFTLTGLAVNNAIVRLRAIREPYLVELSSGELWLMISPGADNLTAIIETDAETRLK